MSQVPGRCEIYLHADGGGGLSFRYFDFAQGGLDGGSLNRAEVQETEQFVTDNYYTTMRGGSSTTFLYNGEYATAWTNLMGLGHQLYRRFVTRELSKATQSLADGSLVHIVCPKEEIWIPWELVYNGIDFWGRRLILTKTLSSHQEPVQFTSISVNKIVNVVGAGLPKPVKARARRLFSSLVEHVNVVLIDGDDPTSTAKLYQQVRDADLIHLTCHGYLESNNLVLQIVSDKRAALNFMASTIGVLDFKQGCVVFANACGSASMQGGRTTTLGFGPELCTTEHHANAFVGALDLIPDMPAVVFAETFYSYFLAGIPIGEALRLSKMAELREGEARIGLFPLLYSLYGNALCATSPLYEPPP